MKGLELENARRRLVADLADVRWVSMSARLYPGNTTAYYRRGADVFHSDHSCPHFQGGSNRVKLYPLWFARKMYGKSACSYCVAEEWGERR